MLALQVVAQGSRLEKRTVERPQAASGQVVIRVRAAGICRSDVHYIDHVERIGPLVRWRSCPLARRHGG